MRRKNARTHTAHRSYLELNLLHDHVFHSRAEVSRFEDDVLFSSHVEKHISRVVLVFFFFFERIDYVDRPAPILSLSLFGGTNARAPKVSPLCLLLLLLLGISPRVVVRFDSSSLSRAGALRRENSKARSKVDISKEKNDTFRVFRVY